YINTGHGSKGFTSAPWCAELLAQRICGETASNDNVLLGAMNPNRFLLKRLGLKRLAKMA
ncbi:MAG TPA: FAD-dependent oxidoreductase, partial [Methylotenera sp.]|nr:FAD-dependent oxidoreductase [Methylotenera sp.]